MGRIAAPPDVRLREVAGTDVPATADRITATYERASPDQLTAGARWYAGAGTFIDGQASLHQLTREHVAAVIAHLSPRQRWDRNVRGAELLLATGDAPGHLRRSVTGALRARRSADPLGTLTGPKTRAFAANLLGDRDAVTVDVWAGRVALGHRPDLKRILALVGVYAAIAAAYREAADLLGLAPADLQAITWVVARNRAARIRNS